MLRIFLLVLASFSIYFDSIAQVYSLQELRSFYNDKQYNRALNYVDYYVAKNNSDAMILKGDCIRAKANEDFKKVNDECGGDLFNTNPAAFVQQIMNSSSSQMQLNQLKLQEARSQLTKADLKAVDLYIRASELGNEQADRRLELMAVLYPQIEVPSHQHSTPSNLPNGRERCSYCNGTGISPSANSVPGYGSSAEHWCDVCQKMVSASHGSHPRCPSCNGKGYR
ncbi:MAG TPA: hypothetical protein PKE52_09725 [Bacteroidales bacterium]|nr:hypothetical protein [Bacteroidales bacterium]